LPDGKAAAKSLEDPKIRAHLDSGSVGRSVSQTKAASLEQPGSEIESVSFEYTSLRIGPLIHELCGDIGSLLSATGLRRFVVNASRFGNEASLIELFCMAVSLKAYINDISDTGMFAKTRKAKVYRTILLQPYCCSEQLEHPTFNISTQFISAGIISRMGGYSSCVGGAAQQIPKFVVLAACCRKELVLCMFAFMGEWEQAEEKMDDSHLSLLDNVAAKLRGPLLNWLLNERLLPWTAYLVSRSRPRMLAPQLCGP
jgi:hypothetical protein